MPNKSDINQQDQKTTDPNSATATGEKNRNLNTAVPASAQPAGVSSQVENVKDTTKKVLDQAKETAGQAYGLVAEKATSTIKDQKSNLSSGLAGVAESIREVGENLRANPNEKNSVSDLTAKYSDTIAKQVERASTYFEQKDLQEILRDVEHFARRQPAIFIGAAFAAGLLATRFLKSGAGTSASRSRTDQNTKAVGTNNQESNNQNKSAGQTAGSAS